MFYVKAQLNDSMSIRAELNDESVYTTCPGCGNELQVDLQEAIQAGDFDLCGTHIYCEECSKTLNTDRNAMVTIPCPCGRTEHYTFAAYCSSCGEKLERAADDGSPREAHF